MNTNTVSSPTNYAAAHGILNLRANAGTYFSFAAMPGPSAQATNPRLVLGFDSYVQRQTLNIENGSAL